MKNKTKNLFLKQYGTLFTETRQAQGRRQHTAQILDLNPNQSGIPADSKGVAC